MPDIAWRLVAGVLVLAIIFVVVRPGSKASGAVVDLTSAMKSLVTSAVGS